MKIRKGQYGYRDQHKKSRALLTGLFAVAIIAQLIARQLASEQAAKNILTVMCYPWQTWHPRFLHPGSTAHLSVPSTRKRVPTRENAPCCMISLSPQRNRSFR